MSQIASSNPLNIPTFQGQRNKEAAQIVSPWNPDYSRKSKVPYSVTDALINPLGITVPIILGAGLMTGVPFILKNSRIRELASDLFTAKTFNKIVQVLNPLLTPKVVYKS